MDGQAVSRHFGTICCPTNQDGLHGAAHGLGMGGKMPGHLGGAMAEIDASLGRPLELGPAGLSEGTSITAATRNTNIKLRIRFMARPH